MAKTRSSKTSDGTEIQRPDILEKFITHVRDVLWPKCEKKFLSALDDSERKKIQVNFATLLDLSEAQPVVDTTISFKDKCTEGGMDVIKTFRLSTTDQLDDPNQPGLPGIAGNGESDGEPSEQPAAEEQPELGEESKPKRRKKKE